jgi:cytidylate kinase
MTNEMDARAAEIKLTNPRVVAIDGGVATGKSRLVEELAGLMRRKGVPVLHVSSGHLYRAVTYAAIRHTRRKDVKEAVAQVHNMPLKRLLDLAKQHRIEMHNGQAWLDGAEALEEQVKGPGVGASVSYVSSFLPIRELVNAMLRRQVNEFDGFVIMDGRDIGGTVLPDAPLKLLLTVHPSVALQRSPEHSTIEEIMARNHADQTKPHGALKTAEKPGDGVVVIATDNHTPESVRDEVYGLMRTVWPELPAL